MILVAGFLVADWEVAIGALVLGAACFLAGWKMRDERDLYLRATGRRTRGESWPPW